jgi:hypothetical protein
MTKNMKKIITSLFVLILGVFMTSGVVHAAGKFNTDSRDLPTVMVTNVTDNPGCQSQPGAGCWSTSVNANPGDTIGVQVYFHNSTIYLAEDTTLSIKPKTSSASSTHTFTGGVAATTIDRAVGNATVRISSAQSLTFIPGTVRVYKNGDRGGYTVGNESTLFGTGLHVGDVSPGWDTQGTLSAQFKVSGNNNPVDPEDNDCTINSFTADDDQIDEGDSTRLNWRTTGCDYVDIESSDEDFSNENPDDSVSVSPDRSTTYTLRAYDRNGILGDTDTVRISVDEDNNNNNGNTCGISSFDASPSTIEQGRTSTLRWNTTGDVDYVTISSLSGQRSGDSSVSVSPYSTTSYTLRAYCDNGDSETETTTVRVNSVETSSAPQALTTVATVLNGTQARLNGIAIPHTTSKTTSAWFEWGIGGSYNNRTNSQIVPLNNNSYPYSDLVSGLVPGVTYTYRAVVQNTYGTAYGGPVTFRTSTPSTTQPVVRSQTVRNVVVAQSAASLLELRVESNYDRMCVNGQIDYTITYRNISSQTLEKSVLQFTHPKEITYLTASRGEYEVVDRTMTIALGNIAAGEQGVITVRARVNETAIRGNLTVATATVVYTNTRTRGQEDATAYSLITVSDDCPNNLGASAFGFGSFLPTTLLGWLLLILVILALIVLARQFQKKPVA